MRGQEEGKVKYSPWGSSEWGWSEDTEVGSLLTSEGGMRTLDAGLGRRDAGAWRGGKKEKWEHGQGKLATSKYCGPGLFS